MPSNRGPDGHEEFNVCDKSDVIGGACRAKKKDYEACDFSFDQATKWMDITNWPAAMITGIKEGGGTHGRDSNCESGRCINIRGNNICMPVDTSKATCGGGLGSKANSDYGDPTSDPMSIFNLNPVLRTLDKAQRAEMGLVGFQQGPASPKCGREFKTGLELGHECQVDTQCQHDLFCNGGGLSPFEKGTCTACPYYCGDQGCYDCTSSGTNIQCGRWNAEKMVNCTVERSQYKWAQFQQCMNKDPACPEADKECNQKQKMQKQMQCVVEGVKQAGGCLGAAIGVNGAKCEIKFGYSQTTKNDAENPSCLSFKEMLGAVGIPTKLEFHQAFSAQNMTVNGANVEDVCANLGKGKEGVNVSCGLTLNLDAKIEMLPTGVHVTAIPKDKKYEVSLLNAGMTVDLGAKLEFQMAASYAMGKTKFVLSDGGPSRKGLTACNNPQGLSDKMKCKPTRVLQQVVMAGPVPLAIEVEVQMIAIMDANVNLDAKFTAEFNYTQNFGFDEITLKAGSKPIWLPKDITPTIRRQFSGEANIKGDFSFYIGPEITVKVNGLPLTAALLAKLKLEAEFGLSYSTGTDGFQTCVKGSMGISAGLAMKMSTGLPNLKALVASAGAACTGVADGVCESPAGHALDCSKALIGNDFTPCDDAKAFCVDAQKTISDHLPDQGEIGHFMETAENPELKTQFGRFITAATGSAVYYENAMNSSKHLVAKGCSMECDMSRENNKEITEEFPGIGETVCDDPIVDSAAVSALVLGQPYSCDMENSNCYGNIGDPKLLQVGTEAPVPVPVPPVTNGERNEGGMDDWNELPPLQQL